MAEDLYLDLVFVVAFLTLGIGIILHIHFNRISSTFYSLLQETERYSNPLLISLDNEDIPDPVARYLKKNTITSDSRPSYIEVHYSGFQRIRPETALIPIKGKSYYALARPGFVSCSRFSLYPLIWIDIIQRYSINDGHMEGKILSIFPTLSLMGLRMSKLCLSRYFSDAVWFPWIFDSSPNLRWESIDERSAKLRISYHPLIVSFIVRFNEKDQIESMSSFGEYVDQNGVLVPYERIVTFRNHSPMHGLNLPLRVTVVWKSHDHEQILQDLSIQNVSYCSNPFKKGR